MYQAQNYPDISSAAAAAAMGYPVGYGASMSGYSGDWSGHQAGPSTSSSSAAAAAAYLQPFMSSDGKQSRLVKGDFSRGDSDCPVGGFSDDSHGDAETLSKNSEEEEEEEESASP